MKISQSKRFKDITTFRIGGKIKYYIEVKDEKDILPAVQFAKKNNLKIFIVGDGSDFLAADKDFPGVVIKFTGSKLTFREKDSFTFVTAEAGLKWDKLVEKAVRRKLQGIECLSGIPGTVGGAPIQNIGAYGQEISDVFYGLVAYDLDAEKFVTFDKSGCKFGYRDSIFKSDKYWQKYLIANVTLKLQKNNRGRVNYESLKGLVDGNTSLSEIRKTIIDIRNNKLENPKKVGNAGSFFKNPIIEKDEKDRLEKKFPGIKIYPYEGRYKVSAAWLIDKAGWKGKSLDGAAVSSKHALILINKSGFASSRDVFNLSEIIIKDVYKKFGIKLEREVQLINFSPNIYEDKKIAVLGFGIEGKDAIRFLLKKSANITVFDAKREEELDFEDINKGKVSLSLGKDYLKRGLMGFDTIVRSPGVYRFLPEISEAEKKGAKITSAIKIFFEECPAKIIGVTGTKGKGTTSTLIYEILKAAGKDVYLAGNIGKPYLELLTVLNEKSFVVMEMSSFQLIDMDVSPHVAVVLNITEDHMDWHKDRKEYIDAKKNIVKYQLKDDFAVINKEYETSKSFAEEGEGRVVYFSKRSLDAKYKKGLILRGEHNLENIAAGIAVAKIIGVGEDLIKKTVRNFKGLEHRLEFVREVKGVKYYNDSFATGPQPTIAAINSFSENETLILGGSDKGLNYSQLGETISQKKNVKNIILIGDTRGKIAETFKGLSPQIGIFDMGYPSMKEVVRKAYTVTPEGGVVILSPASASFDMFKNYKDRGAQFKSAVESLKSNLL